MYSIIEETLYQSELGEYLTYGIQCRSGRTVSDVWPDKAELTAFVAELNRWDLDEIHLDDAVADFLER